MRLVRRDLGLTQAEMAESIGVGLKAYGAWESGINSPSNIVETAELLERATGIAWSWWLGRGDGGDGETEGLPQKDSNLQPAGSRFAVLESLPRPSAFHLKLAA